MSVVKMYIVGRSEVLHDRKMIVKQNGRILWDSG